MSKNTKSFEIKIEYLVEDGEKFWKCLDEIENHIDKRQDIPFRTALNLLSVVSKSTKLKHSIQRERMSVIYQHVLNRVEEEKIVLDNFVIRHYQYPDGEIETVNEEYNIENLVASVVRKFDEYKSTQKQSTKNKKDVDFRFLICRFVIEYLNRYDVSVKEFSHYKRGFVSCMIVEALGDIVLDKKKKPRTVRVYYNAIQHHYKKAKAIVK